LEARGVRGPALMFEASSPNAELVRAFARSVPHPITSSAFYAMYKTMPHDTDFTVFRNAGFEGVNLAFIGGAGFYHTPSDHLAHLDLASLQHQGDQVLAFLRELVASSHTGKEEDAVFFDVLGRHLFIMSVAGMRLLAVILGGVAGGLMLWGFRRRILNGRQLAAGLGAWFAIVGVCLLVGTAFSFGFSQLQVIHGPWPANGGWFLAASLLAAVSILLGVAAWLQSRLNRGAAVCGAWSGSLLLSLVVCLLQPEAAYLWTIPLFLAIPLLVAALALPKNALSAVLLVLAAVANTGLWAPFFALLFDALGLAMTGLTMVLSALLVLPVLPLAAEMRPRVSAGVSGIFAAFAVLSVLLAVFCRAETRESSARVNIAHHWDNSKKASRWLLDAASVPAEVFEVLPFTSNAKTDAFPWFGMPYSAAFEAPAPALKPPAPTLQVLHVSDEGESRRVTLQIRPAQDTALAVSLGVPAGTVTELKVEDEPASLRPAGALETIGILGPGASGARLTLRTRTRDRVSALLVEQVSGLPREASRLRQARDTSSTASQLGDLTIVSQRVEF
jgi:hypothetical protein